MSKDTHGSPELDEDAVKLLAMGADPGPTLDQVAPQQSIEALLLDLATFTEYQLATLEGLPKRTSQCERRRQQSIADQMVAACRRHGVVLPPLNVYSAPRLLRLRALLEAANG